MENEKTVIPNLDDVVEENNTNIQLTGDMGVVMADAYVQSEKVNKHIQQVKKELDDRAKQIETESPDTGHEVKNEYTAKLTLDESLSDFNITEDAVPQKKKDGRSHSISEEDDLDIHLDYDMQWFISGLVAEEWPKPKNPFKKTRRKARRSGRDAYADDTGNEGVPQVATSSSSDAVTLYFDKKEDFADTIRLCDYYKLKYSDIRPKKSSYSRWNFNMDIYIPMTAEGYPMMVEDYLNSVGMTIDDAMDATWCSRYRNKKARIEREAQKMLSSLEKEKVDKLVKKSIIAAARDTDTPIEDYINQLFTDLDVAEYTYDRAKVIKAFKKEFPEENITIE